MAVDFEGIVSIILAIENLSRFDGTGCWPMFARGLALFRQIRDKKSAEGNLTERSAKMAGVTESRDVKNVGCSLGGKGDAGRVQDHRGHLARLQPAGDRPIPPALFEPQLHGYART